VTSLIIIIIAIIIARAHRWPWQRGHEEGPHTELDGADSRAVAVARQVT
jgi:hypothetical protein